MTITLQEYETCFRDDLPPPSEAEQAQLARLLGDRLEALWLSDGRCRLRSSSWVGVIPVGSRIIRIVPKLAGAALDVLTMLGVATGMPVEQVRELQRRTTVAAGGSLVDLLISLLCAEVSALLSAGALQDYREEADDLAVLRGRLDLQAQATRHYGRVDVLRCRFEQFDHDVMDNRLLTAALRVASTVAEAQPVRLRAAALLSEMEDLAPGPLPPVEELRSRLAYDRRNSHYRNAHIWALALLEGNRLRDPFVPAGSTTGVFLLDMNVLFERFVTWLVQQALSGHDVTVTPQVRDASILWRGTRSWGSLRPDLLLRKGDRSLAVDAKYKRYDLRRVAVGDVYQLFVYARAYSGLQDGVPRAVLVYPSEGSVEDVVLDLRPRGHKEGSVYCIGVDLPPLLAEVRAGTGHLLPSACAQVRRAIGLCQGSRG